PTARNLDVIGIVTQAPQADQIVQELIGDACERVPEENAEDDDFAPGWSHGHTGVSACSNWRMTRAGLPTATVKGGTSETTTERAPTTAPSPMVTPGKMQQSNPTQTFEPIRSGLAGTSAATRRGQQAAATSSDLRPRNGS